MEPDDTTRGGRLKNPQKMDGDDPIKRRLIVTIGIDHYTNHEQLRNAVNDANGVYDLFTQELGFTAVAKSLHNDQATKSAINGLIEDQLPELIKEDDALFVFFAGHGQSRERGTSDQGYLVPVDAKKNLWSQYIKINTFLESLDHLLARHIIVILDACHSGFALGSAINSTRGEIPAYASDLLREKSRHVLTSAKKNQLAQDGGPIVNHSLFTGCLIDGLRSGLADSDKNGLVTTSDLGAYVRKVVGMQSGGLQTPDFGRFASYANRGEMVFLNKQIKPQISGMSGVSLARVQELDELLKTMGSWKNGREGNYKN